MMKKAGYRQVKADSPNVIRMGGGRVAPMFGKTGDGGFIMVMAERNKPFSSEEELDEFFEDRVEGATVLLFDNREVAELFATNILTALQQSNA